MSAYSATDLDCGRIASKNRHTLDTLLILFRTGCWIGFFVGVWFLWRRLTRDGGATLWIISAGLALRLIGCVVAISIPALDLPVPKGYVYNDEFLFYGRDAETYFVKADGLVERGAASILNPGRNRPSIPYIQAVAISFVFLGRSVASALSINILAYLGMCWFLTNWPGHPLKQSKGVLFALSSVSLAPGWILWATQPLKDALFMFTIVGGLWMLQRWKKAWREGRVREAGLVGTGFLAFLVVFSGIRWYSGVYMLAAAGLFFAVQLVRAPRERAMKLIVASLVVLILGGQLAAWSPGRYAPMLVHRVLSLTLQPDIRDSRLEYAEARAERRRVTQRDSMFGAERPRRTRRGTYLSPGDRAVTLLPDQRVGSLAVRVVAVFVPITILRGLGVVAFDGGRGLLWFADLDSLWFSLTGLIALAFVWRNRRQRIWRDEMFLVQCMLIVVLAGLLPYAVRNYGTLMRIREIVMIGFALLPLVIECAIGEIRSGRESGSREGESGIESAGV